MIIEAREDTITLRGAVKSNIWPAIQAAAALLLENHPTGIIIDCSPITQFTSAGAKTFADAFNYIHAHKTRIFVVGLSPDLIEITRTVPEVRSQLPIAASVEEARASLQLEELIPYRGKARIAGVVPLLGDWRRALYYAGKLARGENCEIHLVDMIKVSRNLPLETPQPEREVRGLALLEEAKAITQKAGIRRFTHVERVRSESGGLIDFKNQLNADFATVSIDRGEIGDPYIAEPEALSLLQTADFEILLIKGCLPERAEAGEKSVAVPAIGAWEQALDRTCKLVAGEDIAITVIHSIVIPRSEPIDTPKPDEQVEASDCEKEALRIGKKHDVKINFIPIRVRDPILGLLKTLSSIGCSLTVIGVRSQMDGGYSTAYTTAAALLREPSCETIFMRVADS